MTLFQKSLLATGLMVLALAQLSSMAVARGWIGSSSFSGRTLRRALYLHRAGGYIGLALIVFIAYYCIFEVQRIGNPYKMVHIFFGAAATVLVLSKFAVVRFSSGLRGQLPVLGLALLAAVAGAWATSALWYLIEF